MAFTGEKCFQILVIGSLHKVAILWRRAFGVPVHSFVCSYLHEQNQSLEFTVVTTIENFELHQVGFFHA